jgi:hypothetical protein
MGSSEPGFRPTSSNPPPAKKPGVGLFRSDVMGCADLWRHRKMPMLS